MLFGGGRTNNKNKNKNKNKNNLLASGTSLARSHSPIRLK